MVEICQTKKQESMKKFVFGTILSSLMAFPGCQVVGIDSIEDNPSAGDKTVTITANIAGSTDTKVSLTPDTDAEGHPIVKVDWKESGETFEVYGSSGTSSTFTQIAGTNQFEGTLPEPTNGEYEAIYGNPNSLDEQNGGLGQSTANDSPVLMSAMFSSSSSSITFEHATAILKPTFKVDGDNINNTITQIVMGNVAKANSGNAGNGYYIDEITITPADLDNIYIHLFVFPQVYIAGHEFTFTVTAGGKNYTGSLTIPTGMSIEAGKLYTADIALTEVPVVNYVWTSGIEASESVEGEGTETSPYLIQSANDLQWMIDQVNNAVQMPCAIDDDESSIPYYSLTHDLEIDSNSGATWTPIGTSSSPFVGYFDGGGYTISGEMVELVRILLIYSLTYVTEAVAAYFCKMDEFLLSLSERKFRSVERTSGDKFEPENFGLTLRLLDKPYHSLLDKRNEPYKNKCVGHIEEGVKHCDSVKKGILVYLHFCRIWRHSAVCDCCKLSTGLNRIIESEGNHYMADQTYYRFQQAKNPDNSDYIENSMRTCRSFC